MSQPMIASNASVAPSPAASSRGQMGRYALWQVFDFARYRGVFILGLASLLAWPFMHNLRFTSPIEVQMAFPFALTHWIQVFGPLFATMASARLVSPDRKDGAFRFLFAKPVSVPRFYGQLAVLHYLAFVTCWLLLIGAGTMLGAPIPMWPILQAASVMFVALGGLYFLASVLTIYDFWAAGGVWVLSYVLYDIYGDRQGLVGALVHVLPPAHRLGQLVLTQAGVFEGYASHDALWLAGYGLGCFVLGVALLARKPLASG